MTKALYKTGCKLGLIVLVEVEDYSDFFIWLSFSSYFQDNEIIRFDRYSPYTNYFTTEYEAKDHLINVLCAEFDKRTAVGKEKANHEIELYKQINKILNFNTEI